MQKHKWKWKSLSHDRLFPLHGLYSLWNSPGQNTGAGNHSFLQGDLPNPGIEPRSPTLQADSLPFEPPGKPKNTGVGCLSLLQQVFPTQESNQGLLHGRWILNQLSYEGKIKGKRNRILGDYSWRFQTEGKKGKKKMGAYLWKLIWGTKWVIKSYFFGEKFPGGSDGKESAWNGRNPCLIPGSGRSPGEGLGKTLHHSCLENPMDKRSVAGYSL